ncbi:Hypoxia-inducible factor 1-alpha [Trachymyrmex zeteki]|uniref:Hypoxia-inducible factor 1-alpha n=1 Tax=Mycetomoellerius zeteki TaxID=64791 RepID=A0A151WR93_9HYME|nr:Hypoxia-inducible factor 1-alpha [Trachymyrmex zeteki]
MNARLHEVAAEREREGGGKTKEEGGNIILGDGHQQRGRCSDLPDDWIGKVSVYTGVDARHMVRGNEIDFPSREFLKPPLPPPSYGPAIAFNNVLPDTIAAPSPSITSHVGDNIRSRACDIETTSCSTMRFPYAPGTTCNVACSNAPATICNVAPASADCDGPETTWFRNEGRLAESQSGVRTANTATSRICHLGPIDVEDLAMYFDSPTDGCKPPSLGNRAIYSKKSRYGQVARIDQSQEHHRDLNFRDLPSCDLASNNLQTCDMGPNTLGYCDLGNSDLRLRNSGYDGPSFCDPRLSDSRFCGMRLFEEQPCEPGRHNLERGDPGLGNWFCNDCPELFNFCSEERWLQCSASDRCPLYDTSYAYDVPVFPPCMYENGYNDNWHYDNAEDEQLLENYLSNEKRKERSRDAARCRRSRETDIFTELAAALPVAPEQAALLDKASVMRLAIAYLKVRAVVDSIPVTLTKSESSAKMDELFPKALNGFMLVLSSDGNMVYLSENVRDYLGVSQMDMMGQSIYEYSHPCDHDELRECLSSKSADNNEKRTCNFFLRLKCTLTSKGRKVNLKSASYKVIHCTGRLTNIRDSNSNSMEVDNEERRKEDEDAEQDTGTSLVLVGSPIPHPSNIEIPLGRHTFLSKHSLSMKFTYADEKLAEYLGWSSEELMGRSVFEFYHALDNLTLDKCFKCLFSKGQCETVAYRFLGKRGGYAWVITQATLIHCSKQQKPISVVCVNYILSAVSTTDSSQVSLNDEEKIPVEESTVDDESRSDDRPFAVTASIFHSIDDKSDCKDDSQKDGALPKRAQKEKAFVFLEKALKESLEESIKENNVPATVNRQSFVKKAPFIFQIIFGFFSSRSVMRSLFQGKPTVVNDSSDSAEHRDRPQSVTRHLFAPLVTTVQQQEQQQQQEQEQSQLSCRPQTATASIFAPRTEDMNKGFLTFSEDQPGLTMLKDEPEDLTHLAPTAGDVCVPLEDTPFLSDMLDEFIFGNDNYGCPLLSPGDTLTPELRSTDLSGSLKDADLVDTTTRTKNAVDRLADSDPFMYGDSPGSPCGIDPSTVSPSLSKYQQSPERSVDSLGSPTGGSGGDGLSEDEMLMLGISDSIGDEELALRAPYIPMSDQDEALEFLINDNMVMWSSSQSADKGSSKWLLDDREQRNSESSLAQLLRTDQAVSRRYNDHGGGLLNSTQILGQTPRKNMLFESDRWSSNQERPNKRIHSGLNTDSENEYKRFKCEDSSFERINLEDTLVTKQQRQSTMLHKKSPPTLGNTCGSQLLRRLVSSQMPSIVSQVATLPDSNGHIRSDNERHREDFSKQRDRDLDDIIDFVESEGDRGGGGGGGENHGGIGDGLDKIDVISRRRNPSCGTGGSSVLMNLLVSGCDDPLMSSRDMSTVLSSNLTPLSINVDNQIVPHCANTDVISLPDHLSPDTRKHLIGPFTGGGGDGGTPIVSPTTSAMASFDSFDWIRDGSTGLLQVGSDLLGGLLDRNLV